MYTLYTVQHSNVNMCQNLIVCYAAVPMLTGAVGPASWQKCRTPRTFSPEMTATAWWSSSACSAQPIRISLTCATAYQRQAPNQPCSLANQNQSYMCASQSEASIQVARSSANQNQCYMCTSQSEACIQLARS